MVIQIINKIFVYNLVFSSGADNDLEAAKEFVKNKYLESAEPKEINSQKNIYPHFTCSVG
jgi:hypothetical protein